MKVLKIHFKILFQSNDCILIYIFIIILWVYNFICLIFKLEVTLRRLLSTSAAVYERSISVYMQRSSIDEERIVNHESFLNILFWSYCWTIRSSRELISSINLSSQESFCLCELGQTRHKDVANIYLLQSRRCDIHMFFSMSEYNLQRIQTAINIIFSTDFIFAVYLIHFKLEQLHFFMQWYSLWTFEIGTS